MKKIISFSGTHGTGKTYQAQKLVKELRTIHSAKGYEEDSVVLSTNLVRSSPFGVNTGTINNQMWILSKKIQTDLKFILDETVDIVVSDRSVLDSIIYSNAYGLLSNGARDGILSMLCGHVITNYVTPIMILPGDIFQYNEPDDVRNNDTKFRNFIDDIFADINNFYGCATRGLVDANTLYNLWETQNWKD